MGETDKRVIGAAITLLLQEVKCLCETSQDLGKKPYKCIRCETASKLQELIEI